MQEKINNLLNLLSIIQERCDTLNILCDDLKNGLQDDFSEPATLAEDILEQARKVEELADNINN